MKSNRFAVLAMGWMVVCAGTVCAQTPDDAPRVTLPAGTIFEVETLEALDSTKTDPGHTFPVTLKTELDVDGNVVVPSGSQGVATLMGKKAGETSTGKPELFLQLTSITIANKPVPVVTEEVVQQNAKTRRQRQERQVNVGVSFLGNVGDSDDGGTATLNKVATTYSPRMKIPKGTDLRFRLLEPLTP